jgi:hypothetical protein
VSLNSGSRQIETAGMHPILVQVVSFLIPVSLLAVDFYFWAWIWDASVGPASSKHVPIGK